MDMEPPKRDSPYANKLMLNEWMIEKPFDFETNWLAIPCPHGKRCLVVAARGRTRVFSKKGRFIMNFKSSLPGGGRSDQNSVCVLDCILNGKCLHVLDCLRWGDVSMYETEFQFRNCWIRAKFGDRSFRSEHGSAVEFVILMCHSCSESDLSRLMVDYSDFDGVMFLHKQAPYVAGLSPLSCWLKFEMFPDILNI